MFIGITSCKRDEDLGCEEVLRHTCLVDAVRLGFDYKFFRSAGTLQPDVVMLDCTDDYVGNVPKVARKCRWALEGGYEFLFAADIDTFFCAERLITCGFESFDYFGDFLHEDARQPWPHISYEKFCQGGPGFFMSRKAMEYGVNELDRRFKLDPYTSCFDCYLGEAIRAHSELRIGDSRLFTTMLTPQDIGPRRENNLVTAHLSTIREFEGQGSISYNPRHMIQKYQEWLDSGGTK